MARVRCITEMGMGVDVHGKDATKAARRAVSDAIRHSSLGFFRMGGVQKMVLSGVGAGFLLYVLSKVTEDLSKAELMHPVAAAWLPVLVGGVTGFVALLYQEDG